MPIGIGLDDGEDFGGRRSLARDEQIVDECSGMDKRLDRSGHVGKTVITLVIRIGSMREIFKAGVLANEGKTHRTNGAIPLLANNDF